MVRVDRPEQVPGVVEAAEGVEAFPGEAVDLAVDLGELVQVVVSGDLELEPLGGSEARPAPVVDQAPTGRGGGGADGVGVGGSIGHGGTSDGWGPRGRRNRVPSDRRRKPVGRAQYLQPQ